MIKYFCDRCEKEIIGGKKSLIAWYNRGEGEEIYLCDPCFKGFRKFIEEVNNDHSTKEL